MNRMNRTYPKISEFMERGVTTGVFPGAVLVVVKDGSIVFQDARGWADLFSGRSMSTETRFDLASLTKPLATTLAVARLVQEGKLDIDAELGELFSAFRHTDKAGITLRHLLSHSAGLPAHRPFYRQLEKLPMGDRKEAMRDLLVGEPLVSAIDNATLYSDIGFMILHLVFENIAETSLDAYVKQEIYAPLGIDDLYYIPEGQGTVPAQQFAATELCPWRQRLVCGTVHDENAAVMGGVAGQAGLFGTGRAVAGLLMALARTLEHPGEDDPIASRILGEFIRRQGEGRRALGFDVPEKSGSSCGERFSPHTIGHLGFTGTSFWMDLENHLIVVLLTNRIHPSRYNIKIRQFRHRLHDLIFQETCKQ